ncbi:MAG: hypothetical protein Q4G43_03030 [Mobilicoccus sp.]|nr:hypothetical protein [Mobilicoccus sp.]
MTHAPGTPADLSHPLTDWPDSLVHVVDLTDEELYGLDGPDADQVAPTPWLSGRPAEMADLAAEVGLRSLLTHGRAEVRDDGAVHAADLSAVLDLRHDARAIVYADHSLPSTQETKLLYIHPHVVLTEGVNAAGVHRFEVGSLTSALADLLPWCHPREDDGTSGRLDGDDLPDELEGLQAVVCVDAVGLREDEEVETRSVTFFRLADGSVVEHVDGSSENLDLRARTDAQIDDLVTACITEAMASA